MKTNRKLSIVSLLALGVLAAGFNPKPASAQEFEGKFTLPSEVRWGLATLPAGQYSFTMDRANPVGLVRVYHGPRPVALILPQSFRDPNSERSAIVVVAGIVRKLSLPQIGLDLTFAAHKPAHCAAPQEEELAQTIPVTAGGAAGR